MGTQRLPPIVEPMLATAGPVPSGDDFAQEPKLDGIRAHIAVAGDEIRIVSRNGRDVTASFPDLAGITALAGGTVINVDGEIVALDAKGIASFGLLQQRMHVLRPTGALLSGVPVSFYAFDILYCGKATLELSYVERREVLDGLKLRGDRIDTTPWFTGADGRHLANAARQMGLEGVVSKRLSSVYRSGRTKEWIKTPLIDTVEAVIGGYRLGEGRRAGTIGSLLLGIPDASGNLHYIGSVGTGFTDAMLREVHRQLQPLHRSTSPFAEPLPAADAKGAQWVEPKLVGEVAYKAAAGKHLRHPSWRGLRPDKSPDDLKI